MKKKTFHIIFFALLFIVSSHTFGQGKTSNPFVTADSLASGNYKDVLTSFFQIAFDKLTGKEKELKFTSNPFAVMMRADPTLAVDTSYKKNRVLRNLNFGFNIKLDTNFHFNGFSSGVSYAIINKRDYTIYDEFIRLALDSSWEFHSFSKGLSAAISDASITPEFRARLREQGIKLLNDTTFTFDKLENDVRDRLLKIISDSGLHRISKLVTGDKKANVAKNIKDGYNQVKRSFQNRLLWTVNASDTTYKDQLLFSNLLFSTQVLKGVSNPAKRSNLEIDIKSAFNIVDDTSRPGRDLKRSVFSFEPGLNWVLKARKTDISLLEFKFSGSYNHIFNGMYPKEKQDNFTFNGTLRVRIISDIWIPLEFKYDPGSGNVFGFLSVKLNFKGQPATKKS